MFSCRSEEDALLNTDQDDFSADTDYLSSWEASKIRIASFPDNFITRKVAERLLKAKKLKNKHRCDKEHHRQHPQHPVSRTYHFAPECSLDNDESESEIDFQKYSNEFQYTNWNDYGTNYTVIGFEPQKDFVFEGSSA